MEQITKVQPSSRVATPVDLNPDQLQLVSGGLPKGTWSEFFGLSKEISEQSLPKGTW
jgi:hypothetical protein